MAAAIHSQWFRVSFPFRIFGVPGALFPCLQRADSVIGIEDPTWMSLLASFVLYPTSWPPTSTFLSCLVSSGWCRLAVCSNDGCSHGDDSVSEVLCLLLPNCHFRWCEFYFRVTDSKRRFLQETFFRGRFLGEGGTVNACPWVVSLTGPEAPKECIFFAVWKIKCGGQKGTWKGIAQIVSSTSRFVLIRLSSMFNRMSLNVSYLNSSRQQQCPAVLAVRHSMKQTPLLSVEKKSLHSVVGTPRGFDIDVDLIRHSLKIPDSR